LEEQYLGEYMPLKALHFAGVRDFVNAKGFGYVKDRKYVAGFRPHQFSKAPPVEKYRIKRLELVSLLMHHGAVVYVSKELPRMKELKKAATRSLTDFEIAGLSALQRGNDMFIREFGGAVHVVGALRSVSQCVECHGGDRGDLLGAFSYSLENATRP
jgi:hypothetical protein